jgi:two-component system, cell cycle response regulator
MTDDLEECTVIAASPSAKPAAGKRARLVVLAGSNVGEMYDLQGTSIVGRGREADIRLNGDGVSRQHARITVGADSVELEDLGSTNGVFVNGDRITRCQLQPDDKIKLGRVTILKFAYQDEIDEDFQRAMFESASRDALTQAYNKRFFLERLNSEFAFSVRHKSSLSLIIFDLDHFKRINDTYGHLGGDFVLATLAKNVQGTLRSEDVFARYGGEEFVVISRGVDLEQTGLLAERLRALTERGVFDYEGKQIAVTISLGVAAMPHDDIKTPEDLIARADKALYEAKRSGRNRMVKASAE